MSWFFCIQNFTCSITFRWLTQNESSQSHAWSWCGGFNKEFFILIHWGPYSFSHLLACQIDLASMNQYREFFVQTSTPTPSMHQKFTEHGKFCMQKKPTPIQYVVWVEQNSIKTWSSFHSVSHSAWPLDLHAAEWMLHICKDCTCFMMTQLVAHKPNQCVTLKGVLFFLHWKLKNKSLKMSK